MRKVAGGCAGARGNGGGGRKADGGRKAPGGFGLGGALRLAGEGVPAAAARLRLGQRGRLGRKPCMAVIHSHFHIGYSEARALRQCAGAGRKPRFRSTILGQYSTVGKGGQLFLGGFAAGFRWDWGNLGLMQSRNPLIEAKIIHISENMAVFTQISSLFYSLDSSATPVKLNSARGAPTRDAPPAPAHLRF